MLVYAFPNICCIKCISTLELVDLLKETNEVKYVHLPEGDCEDANKEYHIPLRNFMKEF